MKFATYSIVSAILLAQMASHSYGQVVINEVQISNLTTIADEDGEYSDWVELYNNSNSSINLEGFKLADRPGINEGWTFGNTTMAPFSHRLVFLSGKDRLGSQGIFHHYEIGVYPEMTWRYQVPLNEPPSNWNTIAFNDNGWQEGIGGIGFGDDDDNTLIEMPATSIYSRTSFFLTDPSAVALCFLNMDYDDAFVAYLNGVEIARANIGTPGIPPTFDTPSTEGHEANGYQGLETDNFAIDLNLVQSLLVTGENVLSLQVHNSEPTSSDITGRAYLIFGMSTPTLQTNPAPEDWDTGASNDHTSFGLSGNETLFLFNTNNLVVDSLVTTPMQPDYVFRRTEDGGSTWCFSAEGTPYAPNTGACFAAIEDSPNFNLESGLYPQGMYITLSSVNPLAEIRYTTDGSKPTETSPLYTSPLSVGATAVVSARCFSSNALPSPVEKNTYLINENSIDIPVISLAIDPDYLWDEETGIHVFGPPDYEQGVPYWGANFWENWEREGYMEYFDADHIKQMEGPVGIKIHGGWSRVNDQKSLRIQAKGKYGMEEITYPLIADKPYIQSYKGFNLRNGGNAYWDYRFHEALIERTCRNTHVDYMSYSPAVVFLNGEYWGFMEIRENLDQHYIANNHDISSNDATVVSANYFGFNIISGDPASFYDLHSYATSNNPSSPDFIETIGSMLDIENYADYIIAQTYWGNGDWSNGYQNNTKLWHDDRPGGKWRFMLMDMDFGMGLAGASPIDNYIAQAGGDGFMTDQLYDAIIQNENFRTYFINRYADLINTEFQSAVVTEKAMAMKEEIAPIFQRHAERWGTDAGSPEWTLNARLTWAAERVQGARNVVQAHFGLPNQVNITLEAQPAGAGRIQISTIQPNLDNGPWQGIYFNGVPVVVKVYANPGYSFDYWAQNEVFDTNNPEPSFEMMFEEDIHFIAVFSGSPINHPVAITEMMFHADAENIGGDWIELRNNTNVLVDLSQWKIKDSNHFNTFMFPEGTLLAANSELVVASDLENFLLQYPEVTNAIGSLGFALSNSSDDVHLLRPSGESYISYTYSDQDGIDLICSDGCGYSRRHASNITSYSPALWTMGCLNGTPGVSNSTCADINYISEINYNSSTEDNSGDWIEMHNPTSATIDLSNWTLSDENNNTFVIPNGVAIDPGAYLIMATNLTEFSNVHPDVVQVVGPTGISFGNGGDGVKLYNNNNVLVYAMQYNDEAPWPFEADGLGKTLEFTGNGSHLCHSNSWIQGCPLGSPALLFDPTCTEISVVETSENWNFSVYPNPSHGPLYILTSSDLQSIRLLDATGREVWGLNEKTTTQFALDISIWPVGIYYLEATDTNNNRQTVQVFRY